MTVTNVSLGIARFPQTNISDDAEGNTLTGGGRTNVWDSQNRLVSVVKGGVTSAFTYGSDGLWRCSVVTQANGCAHADRLRLRQVAST